MQYQYVESCIVCRSTCTAGTCTCTGVPYKKKSAPLSNSNLLVIGVTDKNKLTVFDRDDLYPNVFTGANEY